MVEVAVWLLDLVVLLWVRTAMAWMIAMTHLVLTLQDRGSSLFKLDLLPIVLITVGVVIMARIGMIIMKVMTIMDETTFIERINHSVMQA